ncbi:response regulator transcription factor [Paenibacillus graminis]|uniref:PhoB family transcriptional regulator n=1 Tax=Paenibacillus graminis TaxID=189425 RepID=A0A089M776_9BACL|nr:response regulator transcription factor [Paenibacillus graminis]AIQ69072.1 PhoB family transcriptional regulator [Paenibacillus graminis]MEC0169611.1 response regulator transcription factor [Paenibacillus graminis]
MNRILLIEDEKNLARFIELELQHVSYSVTLVQDGLAGLRLALEETWDLILLDLMLPGLNGIELCRRLRLEKQTPVIMITARDGLSDKINGLDSGADDYIAKPFAIEELLARMRSLLRRAGSLCQGQLLVCQDLQLDPLGRTLTKGGEVLDLTKREFDILLVLMQNMGRVMTREKLMESVWGYETDVDMKVVDVYISYLRGKIDTPGEPSIVQTLRGLGYVIRK